MFGQPRPTFGGGTTGFGTSFSAPNTAATGFGSNFGKPAFGNPASTTSFGTASTPFGAPTSTGPSLFGTQTQPQTGSLFGQGQPSTGFGSTGTGLFSQPQPSTGAGLFGSTPAAGFGAQPAAQSRPFGFGATSTANTTSTTGGLFGTTQPATAGGLFTTTGFGTGGTPLTGTTIKYDPTTGTDTMTRTGVSTNIRTRIEVITTMKEYENKSLEELRVEDYLANRKGPGQGTTLTGFPQTTQPSQPSTGLFGAPPGSSMFASNKQGTENKSLFGTGTPTGFGTSTAGSLFGTTTPSFGQAATSTPGFTFGHTTQTQKTTGFNFASTPTSTLPLFGAATSQPSSFGGTSTGFTFGQAAQPTSTGLFTQNKSFLSTQPAAGSLFGNKPAGTAQPLSSTFGATQSAFGTTPTTSTGGGLFGAQPAQNKTGLFSGFGNTGFGTANLFGQNQPKPGLTFGTPAFGATNTMGQALGTNTGVGLFNQGTPSTTNMGMGLLGGNTGFGFPQQNPMGGHMGGGGGGGMFPDLGKLVKAMTEKPIFDIAANIKTSTQLGQGSTSPSNDQNSPKLTSGSSRPTYVLSPSLFVNKPRPISKASNQGSNRHWLFKGLDDPNEENTEDFLKPKKYPSVRKLNLRVFRAAIPESSSPNGGRTTVAASAPSPLTTPISPIGDATPHRPSQPPSHENSPTPDIIKGRDKIKRRSLTEKQPMNDTLADLNVHQVAMREEDEEVQGVISNEEERHMVEDSENKENNNLSNPGENEYQVMAKMSDLPHPAGIKLTLSEYYILPSLEDLKDMVDSQGQCLVENLTVGRYGYGNVCFLGTTNIAGLDFDSLISIYRKQVEVYPEGTQKPPQGQELNKPAVITLDCVWPVDKTTRQLIKSPERLQTMGWSHYLERQCVKMDTAFIEYRPVTGSWVFRVKHFSKYGLQEENEEEMETQPPTGGTLAQSGPPPSKPLGGLPPMSARSAGPPTASVGLASLPQFMSHTTASSYSPKGPRYLDSPSLQESQIIEEDFIETDIAQEPEESASLSVLSPSAERFTVSSKAAPRALQLAKLQLFVEDEDEPPHLARDITPTPQSVRATAKKLILGQEMNQTRASADITVPKVKFAGQPHDTAIGSPPKASISVEAYIPHTLRDPRSEYELLPSGKDFGREVGHAPPQHQMSDVPLPLSLMAGQDQCLADMSAFMGRSFRVGWGPGWTLVHAGKQLASLNVPEEDIETEMSETEPVTHTSPVSFLFMGSSVTMPKTTKAKGCQSSKLVVEKLHSVRQDPHTFDHLTEACLNDIFKYSVLTNDDMSESEDEILCPLFRPVKDQELLHQLALTASSAGEEHTAISDIFKLCVALWGQLRFYSPESDGANEYSQCKARVEAVGQWLEDVNSAIVQEEVMYAMGQEGEENYLTAIFSHLTARQISDACILAQHKGDHHLALLLAQTCLGEESPRQILFAQLSNWAEGGTDAMMSSSRLVLYSLLAASPTHQASHTTVNTCQGLDWKRAFALHLWYICPATSTIAEVLQEYDQAAGLEGDAPYYCEAPVPPYLAHTGIFEGDKVKYDVCYHLLKLFTDPLHRLETLLNPATVTSDPVDVTVSWLLWRVLESLGYHHLSETLSASLHLSMAALMEASGQWHWAAFILLNITDEERRSREIQELLKRHIVVGKDIESDVKYGMKETFVIEECRIPIKWVHQAKATKARILNMIDEEAWYLLKAGEYNRAHMLIVDTIAPNSIINEDHEYLEGYLNQLSDNGVRSTVVDWAIGGGIYTDYLDVCSVVVDMKKSADPTPAQLEQLRPRLLALCSRLNDLKCTTATHRLCVSEMSRVVVGVLRAVVGDGADATQVLSQQLSGLPLTHDYALAELNLVTEHYLAHLTAQS